MSAAAYPLSWPPGFPRTPDRERVKGRFSSNGKPLSVEVARGRLADELERLGCDYIVLSSNLELRADGKPRSDQRRIEDHGVCVYFRLAGRNVSMPCDRYINAADNIAAIAAHIEATRAIARYGVGTMDQMFSGFTAIETPARKSWRHVLGIPVEAGRPTRAGLDAVWSMLAKTHHPDRPGGDADRMAEINAARDEAYAELGFK